MQNMNDSVTCFMQAVHGEEQVLSSFCLNPAIKKVFLVGSQATYGHIHDKVQHLDAAPIFTGDTIKKIAALSDSEFTLLRSEERRVGKECRSRWSQYHERRKRDRRRKT